MDYDFAEMSADFAKMSAEMRKLKAENVALKRRLFDQDGLVDVDLDAAHRALEAPLGSKFYK